MTIYHDLFSFPFTALGTGCNLHFHSPDPAATRELAQLAIAEVHRIEDRYSRYDPESFLSEINRAAEAGGSIPVDDETAELLDYAFACYEASGGKFDITSGILRRAWDYSSRTVPGDELIKALLPRVGLDKICWQSPVLTFGAPGMELDFGGIGKEYAADRAAELLLANGIRHGLVELGGDIHVIGPHPDGAAWSVDIRHPRRGDAHIGAVKITRGALASSGDYERFIEVDGVRHSHIFDPATGWPVAGLASVSVIAEKCIVAGSICTIAMLKGAAGAGWLAGIDLPHLWMDGNGKQGGKLFPVS